MISLALCEEHPDLFFEMSAEGELIVMAPTYTLTGARNAAAVRQLDQWAERERRGIATDSSTGFRLPNGARRSPDAAWTRKSRIAQLAHASLEKFWHLCPDFVIEIRSATDRLRMLRAKMQEYLEQGAESGWLIDPETRSVTIYRPDRAHETLIEVDRVDGEGVVTGFTLHLARIWNPLGV